MTRHSLRDDATPDYRTTHPSAYRRGHESAAICEGDTARQRNPYRKYSDDWRAFNVGWNAWVRATMDERMAGYADAVRRGEVGDEAD